MQKKFTLKIRPLRLLYVCGLIGLIGYNFGLWAGALAALMPIDIDFD